MDNTKLFFCGLTGCTIGTALICLGDHRPGAGWMTVVAVGIAAVILGIGMLRYLLFKGLKRKGT